MHSGPVHRDDYSFKNQDCARRRRRRLCITDDYADKGLCPAGHNPFSFVENNFLAGRAFTSWEDLNQQARQWCDKVNSTYKKHIRAVPRELFAVERMHLKPLPAWIPEVYRLHQRTVDVEGYVSVNSIRYSVPVAWIGHRVEVRETRDKIEIEMDTRHVVTQPPSIPQCDDPGYVHHAPSAPRSAEV
jgi:Mu transposase, C-terminal domain